MPTWIERQNRMQTVANDRTSFPTKTVTFGEYDIAPVVYAVKTRLAVVKSEISIMKLTQDRELIDLERSHLPPALRDMSREALREQINPWISLQQYLEDWIAKFTFEE